MILYIATILCLIRVNGALYDAITQEEANVDNDDYYESYIEAYDEDYQVTSPRDEKSSDQETTEETTKAYSKKPTEQPSTGNTHNVTIKYVEGSLYDDYGCPLMAGQSLEPHFALFLTIIIIYLTVLHLQI